MKIKVEVVKYDRKIIEKFGETKCWVFEKKHKTDKPLGPLIRRTEKTNLTNIRTEKGDTTRKYTYIKRVREYYEKHYINSF